MNNSGPWISISALLGATSVIMGAFAAHGLENRVDEKALGWIKTGAQYQMFHALAILGWALWLQSSQSHGRDLGTLPGWGFTLGTLIFSGTLYAMSFGAPRWLGAITPIGGTLLIAAWLIMGWQAAGQAGPKSGP